MVFPQWMYVGVIETSNVISRKYRWMRQSSLQLPLTAPWIGHAHATELAAMSAQLDAQAAWSARVQQDLEGGCAKNAHTGRPGLTGEQTLRLLMVR